MMSAEYTNIRHEQDDQSGVASVLRGVAASVRDRLRLKEWAYHVTLNDWPVGIGTASEAFSRDERYGALRRIDDAVFEQGMAELAQTPLEPTPQPPSELPQ